MRNNELTGSDECHCKGLMIAAPNSGSGKTLIGLALLRALKDSGVDICAAKAGPDYIDPAFHAIASKKQSINLDPWATTKTRCAILTARHMGSDKYLLIESMMGLFDGAADGSGSAAHLARKLKTGIVLVVDCAKQSHSIGALVRGFRDHDSQINIKGVILNKVGSLRHEKMLTRALLQIDMPVIGAVRRDEKLVLPQRHLGLVQAGEVEFVEEFIQNSADMIANQCDLELLMKCFSAIDLGIEERADFGNAAGRGMNAPGQNIAIARDEAFSFIYPHLLEDWRTRGAQISFFSPLANEGPPSDCDAVFLPGGYPELHGQKIASADKFAKMMLQVKNQGALIYGECGGFMVLGRGLINADGIKHPMLGFLNLETSFAKRKLHLGYRDITARGDFFAGRTIKGHEFHYSCALKQKGEHLFSVCNALGEDLGHQGLRDKNVMGSYMHLIEPGKDVQMVTQNSAENPND